MLCCHLEGLLQAEPCISVCWAVTVCKQTGCLIARHDLGTSAALRLMVQQVSGMADGAQ